MRFGEKSLLYEYRFVIILIIKKIGRSAMKKSTLIGRIKEIELIQRYYESSKSEMIAVYGRRRVGKTFLIKETMGDLFDFEFIGMYKTASKIQREIFNNKLCSLQNIKNKAPKDWFEAFDRLTEYLLSLKKEKVVVFLDELPWLDNMNSNFLSAFSYFWNSWDSKKALLKLYVCGSATTWMIDKLIGDQGGLYGRVSRQIYLAPFTLSETEQFLNEVKKMNYNKMQVLDAYMILGGIPYYLDMLSRKYPLSVNIDSLFFDTDAPLRTEYDFLFRSLFIKSTNYRKVVEFLSKKLEGQTREDISRECKIEGGELSTILKNLNSCDFIRVYSDPNKKEKGKIYQLTDMFTLFHLRFVKRNNGQDKNFWTKKAGTGEINAWLGYAFEQVCLHHTDQIKAGLGISGILCNIYAWKEKGFTDSDGTKWEGGQIDLIIDRDDKVMNLCEMKYSKDKFTISEKYAETIRNRTSLFQKQTKTKKALRCTFITTYGIKENASSDVVENELNIEDLFL